MRPGISWLDIKLGVRMLVRHRGLTVVAVLGMAVAIALGATVFSVSRTLLDPALPLPGGERLVAVRNVPATGAGATHLHDLEVWRKAVAAIDEFGAWRGVERNLITGDGHAEPLRVAEMTASGFRIAGVPPLLGRSLIDADEEVGAAPVVVLGYDVWQARFGGDARVVGSTVQLGAARHVIIGVMPEGFAFPLNHGVWTPLRLDPAGFERGAAPPVDVFGRLAQGASLEQARAQLAAAAHGMAEAWPDTHAELRPQVMPYARGRFGGALPVELVVFQAVVTLLLLAIVANVAILVYARTATRTGEFAVRLAMGASRQRVVAQLFAEALVLCGVAAFIGTFGAQLVLEQAAAVVAGLPGPDVPFWWEFGLSRGTILYVAGATLLAALVVGVLPALKATAPRIQAGLRELGAASSLHMGRTWTVLIVAQVAFAVAVLPFAVSLAWTEFLRGGVPATSGATDALLAAHVALDTDPAVGADEEARRLADLQAELLRRLAAEPGVAAAMLASHVPGDWAWASSATGYVQVETPGAAEPEEHYAGHLLVEPALFEAYGVAILTGRAFHSADVAEAAAVVIANRSFAEQVLGGGDVVGRRIRYPADGGAADGVRRGEWYEIVGVVEDILPKATVSGRGVPALYHPLAPGTLNPVAIVVLTQGQAPGALAARLGAIPATLDPALRVTRVEPVAQLYRARLRTERLLTIAIVAAMASVLLLSTAGIHALVSFTVARRRREIGIRAALGAQPGRLLRGVLRRVARQLAMGGGIGCAIGTAVMLQSGITVGRAATTLVLVTVVVLVAGGLAAFGPARRGLRIAPTEALRSEG